MIDERTEELASLYVLDLLVGGEQTVFEAQLAADSELQAFVRDLRETTGSLALAALASPPPELKTRLLRRIRALPAKANQVDPIAALIPFRVPLWISWLAAASFAIAAGWLGREFLWAREQIFTLRTEAQLAEIARRDAQNHLAAERIVLNHQLAESAQRLAALAEKSKTQGDLAQLKIATLTSMLGHSPQALAVAVWNPAKQEGVLTIEKLPAAAPDHDYELWVIDPQQSKPVSGGVFAVDAGGRARMQFKPQMPIATITKFAVSREKKGGAPRFSGPQGEVIMISQ